MKPGRERLLKAATDAVIEQHEEESRAYLSGDVAVNAWRPEKYAEAVLTAVLDAGFDNLMDMARAILDEHYPAEFFNESNPYVGDDPGTKLVVALRLCDEARAAAMGDKERS